MLLISTRNILEQIGFKQLSIMDSFCESGLEFDFGNFKLKVCEVSNRNFVDVFLCLGVSRTERTLTEFDFEIPLEVESIEQGIAFISFGLGTNFDAKIIPEWYHQGLLWKNHLPWEKEREAYKNKPSASIAHDYFKLIIQKMRAISLLVPDEDVTTFSFDGEMIKIICSGERIIVPATGISWNESVSVKTKSLSFLPKRIKNKNGNIFLWDNMLHIDNRAFASTTAPSE